MAKSDVHSTTCRSTERAGPPNVFFLVHRGAPTGAPHEVSLPTVNVYNVEFAELPGECYGGGLGSPAPLPASIPMDKIMSNIAPWQPRRGIPDV